MKNTRRGIFIGIVLALAVMIVFGVSACSSSLSEDEKALFKELANHVDFTENAVNNEQFSKPFYYVYVDGSNIGSFFDIRKFKNSRTVAFVRSGESQVGVWVDSFDRNVGYASINYVEVCLIDISDPSRKRMVFGESHPGSIQGKGIVYINGEKYEGTTSHWGKYHILRQLIKTIEK